MVDEFYGRITARSQEVQERYDVQRAALELQFGDNPPCPFCSKAEGRAVDSRGDINILKNNYPYEVYDGRGVKEHLMIAPSRHVASFKEFTQDELEDYWDLLAEYHIKGYSSMTRSAIDEKRSVPAHLHTHLFFYFTNQP